MPLLYANDIKFQYHVRNIALVDNEIWDTFIFKIEMIGFILGFDNVAYLDVSNNHSNYIS